MGAKGKTGRLAPGTGLTVRRKSYQHAGSNPAASTLEGDMTDERCPYKEWAEKSEKLWRQRCRDFLGDEYTDLLKLKPENDALRECLGFFASVIKSGEPWTFACQEKYDTLLGERPKRAG